MCTMCDIKLKPTWKQLETVTPSVKFGGKLILVGSITFHKKAKEKCAIERMALEWHGKKLNNLQATLYRKLPEKEFLPIEENVLGDSTWNEKKQMLLFDFADHKQTLGPLNIFYVVLTIPLEIESIIKKGHFSLVTKGLPNLFQQYVREHNTDLAMNTVSFLD